jgi:hypothetical protein
MLGVMKSSVCINCSMCKSSYTAEAQRAPRKRRNLPEATVTLCATSAFSAPLLCTRFNYLKTAQIKVVCY